MPNFVKGKPMFYGQSQFAPFYYYVVRGGNVWGLADGDTPGSLVEVQVTGDLAAKLLRIYGDEDRYIRANYMNIEDSIEYTDARIRAITEKEKATLRKLVSLLGGGTKTLYPFVMALESLGNVVVPNNNDIQHVLALYVSHFYTDVAEHAPEYLTFGFDDEHTSMVPKSGTGMGDILGGIFDTIKGLIQAGISAANEQELAQWLSWYNSQVVGVDGRDIQKQYDRAGAAAALSWLRNLKNTSWADIDKYIRGKVAQWGIPLPDAYAHALAKWDELETNLMKETGEIPGPKPPATDETKTPVDPKDESKFSFTSGIGLIILIGVAVLFLPKLLK